MPLAWPMSIRSLSHSRRLFPCMLHSPYIINLHLCRVTVNTAGETDCRLQKSNHFANFAEQRFQYLCHWTLILSTNSTDWLAFIVRTFNSVFVPRVLNFFPDGPLNRLRVFDNKRLYLMNQRWCSNEIIYIVLGINQRYFSSKKDSVEMFSADMKKVN